LWEKETFEQWGETYTTDVSSVYFTTVAFLPLLEAGSKDHGDFKASVIVISSMSGFMRHAQGHFSYNAAKAGTAHLTKLMSAEFQKLKIRVNSIAPGYFPSEMTAKESGPDMKSELPAEEVQEKGHVPAQRPGSDYDMAQTVVGDHSLHPIKLGLNCLCFGLTDGSAADVPGEECLRERTDPNGGWWSA